MNPEPDPDEIADDEATLLHQLAAALGQERMPDDVVTRAEGLVAWFDVDDELVALLQTGADELVGTRGGPSTAMRFATSDGSTEVELDIAGNQIVGHVVAGDATTVSAERADGGRSTPVDVDELGRFEIVVDQTGAHRLRLIGRSTVTTDWFVLNGHDDERTN